MPRPWNPRPWLALVAGLVDARQFGGAVLPVPREDFHAPRLDGCVRSSGGTVPTTLPPRPMLLDTAARR
ncbi:MAG TPA: hypothetical protein VFQ20_12665 [Burkholderiaceae bacterium]|nr:hypothetical protein [Burkholderiaceae bacterium]